MRHDRRVASRLLPSLAALALGGWLSSPAPAPASQVAPWRPAGISSPQFESHAAFDPRSGDLYFVRSTPEFSGWRIFVSRCTPGGWSAPEPPPFAGDGVEADPWFTADGRSLYFISSRSIDGVRPNNLELWRVDRNADGGWNAPQHLPAPLNSPGAEWFPRLGPDGCLYFGSSRPGGFGATDLWRGCPEAAGWQVENLGAAVNSAGEEYEPLPSADGARLVFMADGDLFEARRAPDGAWSARAPLGPEVNTPALEVGPLFSPSGRSLLFARDTGAPDSGELFVWREQGEEAWPPVCAAHGE